MQRRILHRVHVILTQYEVTWMIQPFSLTQNEGADPIKKLVFGNKNQLLYKTT